MGDLFTAETRPYGFSKGRAECDKRCEADYKKQKAKEAKKKPARMTMKEMVLGMLTAPLGCSDPQMTQCDTSFSVSMPNFTGKVNMGIAAGRARFVEEFDDISFNIPAGVAQGRTVWLKLGLKNSKMGADSASNVVIQNNEFNPCQPGAKVRNCTLFGNLSGLPISKRGKVDSQGFPMCLEREASKILSTDPVSQKAKELAAGDDRIGYASVRPLRTYLWKSAGEQVYKDSEGRLVVKHQGLNLTTGDESEDWYEVFEDGKVKCGESSVCNDPAQALQSGKKVTYEAGQEPQDKDKVVAVYRVDINGAYLDTETGEDGKSRPVPVSSKQKPWQRFWDPVAENDPKLSLNLDELVNGNPAKNWKGLGIGGIRGQTLSFKGGRITIIDKSGRGTFNQVIDRFNFQDLRNGGAIPIDKKFYADGYGKIAIRVEGNGSYQDIAKLGFVHEGVLDMVWQVSCDENEPPFEAGRAYTYPDQGLPDLTAPKKPKIEKVKNEPKTLGNPMLIQKKDGGAGTDGSGSDGEFDAKIDIKSGG